MQHQLDQGVDYPRHRLRVGLGVEIDPFAGRVLHRQHGFSRTLRYDIRYPEIGNISQTNNITAAVCRVRRELKKYFMIKNLRPHLAAVRAPAHSQRIA